MYLAAVSLTIATLMSPPLAQTPESGPWSLLGTHTLAGPPTLTNPVDGPLTGDGQTMSLVRWDSQLTLSSDVTFPINGGTAVLNINGVSHQVTGWWFTNMMTSGFVPVHGFWNANRLAFYSTQSFKDRFHHIGYFGLDLTRALDGTLTMTYGAWVSHTPMNVAQSEFTATGGTVAPYETAVFKSNSVLIRRNINGIQPIKP